MYMVKHVVFKINSLKFYFYEDEGRRPHVHVDFKNQKMCEVWLDNFQVKKNYKLKDHELNALLRLIQEHSEDLNDYWFEIFGD
jgi:hypothetical protein